MREELLLVGFDFAAFVVETGLEELSCHLGGAGEEGHGAANAAGGSGGEGVERAAVF